MIRRKALFFILAFVMVLSVASVVSAVEYNEAPMLAEKVAAGELPPVEERLPKEPMVVEPLNSVGTYGGTLRRGITGPNDFNNYTRFMYDALLRYSQSGYEIQPKLVRSMTSNDDFSVWEINMLDGAKWSDGSPFTSADILYWYENVLLNEELTSSIPTWLKNEDGTVVEMTAPDEYTVRFTYKNPVTTIMAEIANMDNKDAQMSMFQPSEYMKQWHPAFTDKAQLEAKAKEMSFDSWTQLYKNMELPFRNPARPVMTPWMSVNTINDPVYTLVRNPYYVAVDTEGNQLPYVDQIDMITYQDSNALNMAVIQGEIDLQDRHVIMGNLPVLLEQAEATGKYTVRLWTTFGGADAVLAVNQYYPDMKYRELLSNHDFRYALSVAIDREEIIESAFMGIGEARQGVPRSTHPYYPGDEYAYYATEYDQDAANKILDDLGLTNRDAEGYRTFADGSRIMIEINWVPQFANWGDIAQMVSEDWKGVGLDGVVVERERTAAFALRDDNKLMTEIWNEDTTGFPFTGSPKFDPRNSWNTGLTFAIAVRDWVASDGKEGEAPTADFARIMEIVDIAKTKSEEEKVELAHELFQIWSKGLYEIGIAGLTPMIQGVGVVNINLENLPGDDELGNDWPLRTPGNARLEQIYFKK